MLADGIVNQVRELQREGVPIREIARRLGIARNTVRKYVRPRAASAGRPGRPRVSKISAFREYIEERLAEAPQSCAALLSELRARGYTGSYTTLKRYVQPRRRRRAARWPTAPLDEESNGHMGAPDAAPAPITVSETTDPTTGAGHR
jgi:transposase